jgi:LssY C-terminus
MLMTRDSSSVRAILLAVSLAATMCVLPGARGQEPAQAAAGSNSSSQVTVEASQQWVDTNIDLRPGEKLRFTATGEITYLEQGKSKERKFGPDGLARGFSDVIHQYAVGDAGHGALVARLGPAEAGQPFLVGAGKEFVAPVAGRLFLGINQSQKDAASAHGAFQVTIAVLDPGSSTGTAGTAAEPAEKPIASLTSGLLEKIPRRVSDPQGNPGDMVNVLIVGTEDDLVQAFTAAGWVKVDMSVGGTVVSGVLNTLEKKDYLTMPMSTLFLFQRVQDYGFAHAEPVRVAMARNHLRAWKSPYQVDGRPLWCIAATHDVGFERDQRNNRITHKIDPAIDGEREYVNTTLSGTGLVTRRTHVTPANPLKEAKTATGGSFNSDGRILVLVLKSGKSE